MILVDFPNLTFDCVPDVDRDSNVKFNPPGGGPKREDKLLKAHTQHGPSSPSVRQIPQLTEYASREALAAACAQAMADRLRQKLADQNGPNPIGMALSGGSTPGPILRALSAFELDWSRVWVTLVDDRQVPHDHPASNARLLREQFLIGPAAKSNFVPLYDAHADTKLADLHDFPFPLAVALLGMGADGHVASWFPAGQGCAEAMRVDAAERVMATIPDPLPKEAPFARVTLTMRALHACALPILAIYGAEKKALIERELSAAGQPGTGGHSDRSSGSGSGKHTHTKLPIRHLPVRRLIEHFGADLHIAWAE